VADRINLALRRRDMVVFRTIDAEGRRPVVHVAGRHAVALCPSCGRPSVTTIGRGWRDVIDVVRSLVVTLSVCVRRFVCEWGGCTQRSFDERFEGIGARRGERAGTRLLRRPRTRPGDEGRRPGPRGPRALPAPRGRSQAQGRERATAETARDPPRDRRGEPQEGLRLRDGVL